MSEVSNNSKTLFTVKFNGTNSVSVSSTASKEGKVTENGGSSCKCSWYLLKRVEKKIKLKLKKNIISRKAIPKKLQLSISFPVNGATTTAVVQQNVNETHL